MGGKLAHFVEQWEEFTDNKWDLSIVRDGFKIPFTAMPPISPIPSKMSQSSSPLLRGEIGPSQEREGGKGKKSGNFRLLFPDILVPKGTESYGQ